MCVCSCTCVQGKGKPANCLSARDTHGDSAQTHTHARTQACTEGSGDLVSPLSQMLTRLSISDLIGVDTENQRHHSQRGNRRKLSPPHPTAGLQGASVHRREALNRLLSRGESQSLRESQQLAHSSSLPCADKRSLRAQRQGLIMCDIRRGATRRVTSRSSPLSADR